MKRIPLLSYHIYNHFPLIYVFILYKMFLSSVVLSWWLQRRWKWVPGRVSELYRLWPLACCGRSPCQKEGMHLLLEFFKIWYIIHVYIYMGHCSLSFDFPLNMCTFHDTNHKLYIWINNSVTLFIHWLVSQLVINFKEVEVNIFLRSSQQPYVYYFIKTCSLRYHL